MVTTFHATAIWFFCKTAGHCSLGMVGLVHFVTFLCFRLRVPTLFFVARSMHRTAEIPLTRTWLLRRLSVRTDQLWFVPLFHRLFIYLPHILNDFQTTDSGPITSGVNAVATGTPVPTSSSSSSGSTPKSSPSLSSASHIVANGLFAFLAAAFGITLV